MLFQRISTKTTITTPIVAAIVGPGHVDPSVAPNADVATRSKLAVTLPLSLFISYLHYITDISLVLHKSCPYLFFLYTD